MLCAMHLCAGSKTHAYMPRTVPAAAAGSLICVGPVFWSVDVRPEKVAITKKEKRIIGKAMASTNSLNSCFTNSFRWAQTNS